MPGYREVRGDWFRSLTHLSFFIYGGEMYQPRIVPGKPELSDVKLFIIYYPEAEIANRTCPVCETEFKPDEWLALVDDLFYHVHCYENLKTSGSRQGEKNGNDLQAEKQ